LPPLNTVETAWVNEFSHVPAVPMSLVACWKFTPATSSRPPVVGTSPVVV
jgi:hypothetical protein